jgi:DNA-dependent RNA polymerase auxiliary subunit epsilon
MTKEDIEREMSLYVQTGAYETARGILAKNNHCIEWHCNNR